MSGPGLPFLLRYRYANGDVQAGIPLWPVEDAEDRRVGWLPAGSEISYWALADGRDPRSVPLHERFTSRLTTAGRTWRGSDVLRVIFRDRPYQVLHIWKEGVFTGWYVNFETSGGWSGRVIERRDWHLDLWIGADGCAAWKDEDEAAAAVAHGHLAADELRLARDAGDSILADLDAWIRSLSPWRSFVAPAQWRPLALPHDWKDVLR